MVMVSVALYGMTWSYYRATRYLLCINPQVKWIDTFSSGHLLLIYLGASRSLYRNEKSPKYLLHLVFVLNLVKVIKGSYNKALLTALEGIIGIWPSWSLGLPYAKALSQGRQTSALC